MLNEGPNNLQSSTLRALRDQFGYGAVYDQINEILNTHTTFIPHDVQDSITGAVATEARARADSLEKAWRLLHGASKSLEDSFDATALEIKNLALFAKEVKDHGIDKAIGCMRCDPEKEAQWILALKKTQSPEVAVKAAVQNYISNQLEYQKRSAVLHFELRSHNGEWTVNGTQFLDLFKAYREGADRKERYAQIMQQMENNRELRSGFVVSEDFGQGRHYLHFYERSQTDPSVIKGRPIEFKGSQAELETYVKLLTKTDGPLDVNKPVLFKSGDEPSNGDIRKAAELALTQSKDPAQASLFLARLGAGLDFESEALRIEALIEQKLLEKALKGMEEAPDLEEFLKNLPDKVEVLFRDVLNEEDLNDYFESPRNDRSREERQELQVLKERIERYSAKELTEAQELVRLKLGLNIQNLDFNSLRHTQLETTKQDRSAAFNIPVTSLTLLATVFDKKLPHTSSHWWNLLQSQNRQNVREPSWSVRFSVKKEIDDPLKLRDPTHWQNVLRDGGRRTSPLRIELVSEAGRITMADTKALWVLYAQSKGMNWDSEKLAQRLEKLVQSKKKSKVPMNRQNRQRLDPRETRELLALRIKIPRRDSRRRPPRGGPDDRPPSGPTGRKYLSPSASSALKFSLNTKQGKLVLLQIKGNRLLLLPAHKFTSGKSSTRHRRISKGRANKVERNVRSGKATASTPTRSLRRLRPDGKYLDSKQKEAAVRRLRALITKRALSQTDLRKVKGSVKSEALRKTKRAAARFLHTDKRHLGPMKKIALRSNAQRNGEEKGQKNTRLARTRHAPAQHQRKVVANPREQKSSKTTGISEKTAQTTNTLGLRISSSPQLQLDSRIKSPHLNKTRVAVKHDAAYVGIHQNTHPQFKQSTMRGARATSTERRILKRQKRKQHRLNSILRYLSRLALQKDIDLLPIILKLKKSVRRGYFLELLILELLELLSVEEGMRERILQGLELSKTELLDLESIRSMLTTSVEPHETPEVNEVTIN